MIYPLEPLVLRKLEPHVLCPQNTCYRLNLIPSNHIIFFLVILRSHVNFVFNFLDDCCCSLQFIVLSQFSTLTIDPDFVALDLVARSDENTTVKDNKGMAHDARGVAVDNKSAAHTLRLRYLYVEYIEGKFFVNFQ